MVCVGRTHPAPGLQEVVRFGQRSAGSFLARRALGGSFRARGAPGVRSSHCLHGSRTRGLSRAGLTRRSSGAPTAGHQARSGGTRYIFTGPGLASCRRRPLNSNVRQSQVTAVRSFGFVQGSANLRVQWLSARRLPVGQAGGVPSSGTPCNALPNPSLKRSANGRPPGPGRRYAVHFRQPGPGVNAPNLSCRRHALTPCRPSVDAA